jgi:alpha-2-macroglobulin
MKRALQFLFAALLIFAFAPELRAQNFDAPRRADGARVTPDKFLREWDPITIFFDADAGPKSGGAADEPDKLATITPQPAGEWRWLGPRALQFRPAERWTPLTRFTAKAAGVPELKLVSLLSAPSATAPAEGADPAAELAQIALTFPAPVDAKALARLLSIEVRPSPGFTASGLTLTPADFDVLALERGARASAQSYVVKFHEPIGGGRVAVLRLKLADEPGFDEEVFELRALTAPPFAVTDATCGRGWSDDRTAGALRCASTGAAEPAPESGADEGGDVAQAYAPASKRRLTLTFSSEPAPLDILRAREALRFTPPVDDLAVETDRKRLIVTGKFLSDQPYQLAIAKGALHDAKARNLNDAYALRFAFTRDAPTLRWDAGFGVMERYGPQFAPLRGRGYERADIRIHAIDPLSRDFWPFPTEGVETSDTAEPALAGAEPKHWSESGNIEAEAIKERLKALGSPSVSRLVDLPLRRGGADAKFGLDLSEDFARINGRGQPGAYLVGLRAPNEETRRWLRVLVTDLSLSAIEEPARVRFLVTQLSDARPVAGAQVRIEGVKDDKFVTLAQGTTDASGSYTWSPAATPPKKRADDSEDANQADLRRVVVVKGQDVLVVDPDGAPSEYAKETWSKPETSWLSWTTEAEPGRVEGARTLCHLFSERPIYRPEEPVHIKGYVRVYRGGALSLPKAGGTLVVSGPGGQEWRIPVKPDGAGGFYHKFDAKTAATGDFSVKYEPEGAKPKAKSSTKQEPTKEGDAKQERQESQDDEAAQNDVAEDPSCGAFSFKKEAYRLPSFEVVLNAPQMVALDGAFNVDLLARYFAGGLAADRPVKWRAAQFPYAFAPPGREGFLFSTDARFSGEGKFKSNAVLERDSRTDAGGAARISFDMSVEPTAQPRRYSIEATVTGDDGVDVRNVQNVVATPPFVLGVKTPRYVERPGTVTPELVAIDGKGEAVEGVEMTLRLIRRNWISTLQASDFAQGAAKYVTQTQDETLLEQRVASAKEAQKLELPIKEAGVYLVQLEAYDRLHRRQQVSVDFFVGGNTPVTFARAPASTANVTLDRDKYAPGETATLLVQSPFQNARALAIVEEPNGVYNYQLFDIVNGFGRYAITLKKEQTPKLAVHFLIMRGRVKDSSPKGGGVDLGKPVTIAATKWIEVTPVKNIVTMKLETPAKARPGQEIEVALRLTDDAGKPLGGEATFWMVDQAVLSLAKEQPLDPVSSFILARETKMAARDTRNMAFGVIPLEEIVGGDIGLEEWGAENNISVRKNFTPVPIYLPSIKVGADGLARIKVKLPDTLTVFKLRAKAVSGADRFGFAGAEMLIRQELVAQPALPRFLRPGDRADVNLIARVVEGPGGGGAASIVAPHLELAGAASQRIDFAPNKPARMSVSAKAPEIGPDVESVGLTFRIERDADHARDAVEINLPLKPDREPTRRFDIVEIGANQSKTLTPIAESVRAGTFARKIVLASDPAVVKLIAGLNALVEYPYGCTEQRLALARSGLELKSFAPLLAASGFENRVASTVKATEAAIEQSVDGDGLVAFWPRRPGNVSLTAWAYAFLTEAERAGETVDKKLSGRLADALKAALRSDYPRLVSGSELRERVEALSALAEGGALDDSYVAEFVRQADFLPGVSLAQMTSAAYSGGDRRVVSSLLATLWSRIKFIQRAGAVVYGGQAEDGGSPIILPSETRALAEMTRATALAAPGDPRANALRDALLRLGEGDGWGTTNANAAAIRALAESWKRPASPVTLTLTQGDGEPQNFTLDANAPSLSYARGENTPLTIANTSNAAAIALVETSFEPQEEGAKAAPRSEGFALTRALWRVGTGDAAPERLEPTQSGAIEVKQGEVIEETAELVNPEDHTHVAITLPLPAGFEPLNPNIATAPREAQPSTAPTAPPSYMFFGDDRVFYAYDTLPKGNYRFAFRAKAQTSGSFTQPPGVVETMYKKGLVGASAGARVEIAK